MQDKMLCYSARILKLYCKGNQFFSNGIESWNVKNKHEFGDNFDAKINVFNCVLKGASVNMGQNI